jgi:hypothetical protein
VLVGVHDMPSATMLQHAAEVERLFFDTEVGLDGVDDRRAATARDRGEGQQDDGETTEHCFPPS